MNAILEEVKPETAELIAAQARVLRISVDELLNRMLARLAEPQPKEMPLTEVDQILDELSESSGNLSPLPAGFSRADIYFDHD